MSLRDEAFAVQMLLNGLAQDLREDRDELDEEIADSAIEGETNLKEAIEATLRANAEDEAHIAAIKAMVATLQARSARKEKRVQRREGAIMAAFEIAQVPGNKLELASATISVTKGRPKVIETNREEIPEAYMRTTTISEPDKKLILKAQLAGEVVPGCELSNTAPQLRVSPK